MLKTETRPDYKAKTESTWMQGVMAFRAGVGLGNNPYETHDFNNHEKMHDRDGWINGWHYARDKWAIDSGLKTPNVSYATRPITLSDNEEST